MLRITRFIYLSIISIILMTSFLVDAVTGAERRELRMEEVDSETRVLLALADATHFNLGIHVSKHAVFSRFRKDNRGNVEKKLKTLARRGLVVKHPTGGEMTWNLSREGLVLSERLCQDL
jgi:hypothetical protein